MDERILSLSVEELDVSIAAIESKSIGEVFEGRYSLQRRFLHERGRYDMFSINWCIFVEWNVPANKQCNCKSLIELRELERFQNKQRSSMIIQRTLIITSFLV